MKSLGDEEMIAFHIGSVKPRMPMVLKEEKLMIMSMSIWILLRMNHKLTTVSLAQP